MRLRGRGISPPLHRDTSLFQPAQIIAFGKILPVHGQVGVVVGVVQDVRLAVHGIQPLLLGGKAPGFHRVFFVAAAALALDTPRAFPWDLLRRSSGAIPTTR